MRITSDGSGELVEVLDEMLSRTDVPAYGSGRMDTARWDAARRRMMMAFASAMGVELPTADLFGGQRPGFLQQRTIGDWSITTWTNSVADARFSPTFVARRAPADKVGKELSTLGPSVRFSYEKLRDAARHAGWECGDEQKACWTTSASPRTSVALDSEGAQTSTSGGSSTMLRLGFRPEAVARTPVGR